jgi:hypothetical protein
MAVLFMSASFDIDGTASCPYQPLIGDGIPGPARRSPDCENARERLADFGKNPRKKATVFKIPLR